MSDATMPTDAALKAIWAIVLMLRKDFPTDKHVAMLVFRVAWEKQDADELRSAPTRLP